MLCRSAAVSLLALAAAAHAQPSGAAQQKEILIPRIERRPALSEFLHGHSRSDMRRTGDFRQRSPKDGAPASRETSAWIGYDDKNFYAVFVCDSPQSRTRAHLSKREDIMNDDVVGVFLDTYHDHQRSYAFFVNPLGIQADAALTEGQDDDFEFDAVWSSEGQLTDEGFVALIAIPFRSLRFPASDVQTWGLALFRSIPENSESSFWPFVSLKVQGLHQQFGNMTGLEGISPGRNFRITPYGALSQAHFLDQTGPAFRGQSSVRGGLDAKAVIHDSLTLDLALNPDFSQVESDDPQVTVNQRFEVRFPEKRPFFLDNNGYFLTPENLFFSRRIVDPEYGARLTGKVGRWNLGVLGIDDRGVAGEDRAFIGVTRLQREFGEQSSVGVLVTDREAEGSFNRVAALDTRLKLNANWTLTAQAITSQTGAPSGGYSGGDAFRVNLSGQSRNWAYDLKYIDRSEGFHSDLGFIQRVNIRQAEQTIVRRFHPKSKYVTTWGPRLTVVGDFDHRNIQQDWNAVPAFNVEFVRNTFVELYYSQSFERFNNINFRKNSAGFGMHTEYFKRAVIELSYGAGQGVNFDPAPNRSPFLGRDGGLQATITIRPFSRLKLDEIYYLTQFHSAGAAVFTNHLARSRLNYQFNKELSLRLILDYNGVLTNPALTSLERQKRISGDVLLTYLIHPGTAFYIGYTDRLENLTLDRDGLRRTAFPSVTTGRQFFAKLSYQFRF